MSTTPPARARPARGRLRDVLLVIASLLASLAFLALIAVALGVVAWLVLGALNVLPDPDRRWPRLSAWAIVAIPIVALLLAFFISRRSEGRTFYAQQNANRWISALLLVVIIGLLVALGEAIAATFTFDAYGALVGAGLASIAGLGAAAYAHFRGPGAVLGSARARLLSDAGEAGSVAPIGRDRVLLDVARELSLAANMPPPAVYVVDDLSPNAMAVGTNPRNAAIAVTRGMLGSFDREQLQGVVAHELGHIRNMDSRYGVYVAILVGLVALVTDGFLRLVLEAWRSGVFLRGGESDDAKGALAALVGGGAAGLFLLLVAGFLRLFAPIASLLVQAAVSRQREFLADATSVELTRNPAALSRALTAIRNHPRPLAHANRGSQHLWFTSPFGASEAGRWNLFATHPSLDERIERLAELYPATGVGHSAAG